MNEELKQIVKKIDVNKQLIFGLLCTERMIPNYKMFINETRSPDGTSDLIMALDKLWVASSNENLDLAFDIEKIKEIVMKAIPDADEYSESKYISSAIDAGSALYNCILFVENHDINKIFEIQDMIQDTIALYFPLIRTDEIKTHPLYIQEINRQFKDLEVIKRNNIKEINELKEKYRSGKGSLEY